LSNSFIYFLVNELIELSATLHFGVIVKSAKLNLVESSLSHTPPSTEVTPEEKAFLSKSLFPKDHAIGEEKVREVSKDLLVNRLNFVNFQEEHIRFIFRHRDSNQYTFISAIPQPCSGVKLKCRWSDSYDVNFLIKTHDLNYILVPWGEKFIQFIPKEIDLKNKGCYLTLPSIGHEFSRRRVERLHCTGISVRLVQDYNELSGSLSDYSASSFRVEIFNDSHHDFELIDVDRPVSIHFYTDRQAVFSGECYVIRADSNYNSRNYVLEPINSEVPYCRRAKYRSERQELHPTPRIIIRHPLTKRKLNLKVVDLSGSGFSIEEEEKSASLLPGLILRDATLDFFGVFKMTCSAKVVFKRSIKDDDITDRIKCGLAFIDVKAKDHVKLLGILDQLKYNDAYVCNKVDLDALWEFFFDTGFIYPGKYALIAKNKNEIKKTYTKLYINSPEIARHFVYQENGRILGHMATIRFWDNAWLIHHHAAKKSTRKKAGMIVLDQIGRFGHNTFRFQGMYMDYLVCYFRPQNRFPNRIFGGVARHINDPKGCSLDLFSYVKRPITADATHSLPGGWELSPVCDTDMDDLASWYMKMSGGLMLKAFNLDPSNWTKDKICAEFRSHGFRRERYLFALERYGKLKAIFLVNLSDIGLNLSSLTHCINAFILDPKNLPPTVLFNAFHCAEKVVGSYDLPALVYPFSYVEKNSITSEKEYYLWVFHMHSQSQTYFKYTSRLMKYV